MEKKTFLTRYSSFVLPTILVLLSFLMRLLLIGKGPFHVDGLELAEAAQMTFSGARLVYMHGWGFPLTVLCGTGALALAKTFRILDPVLVLNVMNVVLSSLIVLVFYRLIRRILDSPAAFWAAALFSCSPVFLGNSVHGNTHMVSLFLLVCCVLLLRVPGGEISMRQLFLAGAMFGLACVARVQDGMLLLLPILAFLITAAWKGRLGMMFFLEAVKRLVVFFVPTAIIVAVLYLPLIWARSGAMDIPWIAPSNFSYRFSSYYVGFSPRHFKIAFEFLVANFSIPGLFLALAGMFLCFKKDRVLFVLLGLWAAIPFAALSMMNFLMPRYYMLSFLPLYVFQGFVFFFLLHKKTGAKVLAVLLFLAMAASSLARIIPTLHRRHQTALFPDFARWIAQETEDDAVIICSDERRFISFYGERKTLFLPLEHIQAATYQGLLDFKKEVDENLKQGIPVYITYTGLNAYDPNGQISSFMNAHYVGRYVGDKDVEDFHRGVFYDGTYRNALYQLFKKPMVNSVNKKTGEEAAQ